ncbi:MAG: sulfatase-like hydrolase/transferase [Verrucomicrobia bacterium]|nr:sulfatase-like hydrolase/transferase [Verrucomicrobiota bacterium]
MALPFRAVLLGGALLSSAFTAPAATTARPNVIVIISDDHRADCLGYFGHPELQTPHLDTLARRSTVFRHAYVQAADRTAVCAPARTGIHSGKTLYRWSQREPASQDPAHYSLGRAFRAAGYATLRSGKGVNVPSPLCAEFERNVEQSSLPLDVHVANGLAFIREQAGRRPFLLVLEPRVPHSPYPSTEEQQKLYDPSKLRLPPDYRVRHPFLPGEEWPEATVRTTLARYYASLSFLDRGVGEVLAGLAASGQADNTWIVFLGDNGYSIGHHGLGAKSDVYEFGGLHVPLLIAGPGIKPRETQAFVYQTDLLPTLCDLAGVPIPAGVDGRSLRPILEGRREAVREVAATFFMDQQFSVRDARWKLIQFPTHGRRELYDLQQDPHELQDLSADPAHSALLTTLSARLEQEKSAIGYRWPLPGTPDPAAKAKKSRPAKK